MAQFTNQATLSYNGITVNSNIVTGEVVQVLTASKEATTENYTAGDILTYVINLRNTGNADITGLTVSDNLGEYTFDTSTLVPLTYTGDPVLYIVNGVRQASPAVTAGTPLSITGISVPAGGVTSIVYRVRVNENAALGADAEINNIATISGGGLTEAVVAEATIGNDQEPNLTISKALSPSTVPENGQLTYTFTIQNFGPTEADAGDNVIITDTFNPAFDAPVTVSLNGAVIEQAGNYTYDEATGLFTTTAGIITVPAATYTQNPVTGAWTTVPGTAVLTVSGTI